MRWVPRKGAFYVTLRSEIHSALDLEAVRFFCDVTVMRGHMRMSDEMVKHCDLIARSRARAGRPVVVKGTAGDAQESVYDQ